MRRAEYLRACVAGTASASGYSRAHEAEKRIEAGHLSKRRVRGELRLRKGLLTTTPLPVTLAQQVRQRSFPNRALGDRERPLA